MGGLCMGNGSRSHSGNRPMRLHLVVMASLALLACSVEARTEDKATLRATRHLHPRANIHSHYCAKSNRHPQA